MLNSIGILEASTRREVVGCWRVGPCCGCSSEGRNRPVTSDYRFQIAVDEAVLRLFLELRANFGRPHGFKSVLNGSSAPHIQPRQKRVHQPMQHLTIPHACQGRLMIAEHTHG